MNGKPLKRIRQWGPALGVVFALMIVTPAFSEAQGTTVFLPETWIFPGARGAGLGDAISSDTHDIESMYRNPAVLSFLHSPGIMLDYRHDWTNKVFQENMGVPVISGRATSLGLGIGAENSGKLTRNRVLNFTQLDLYGALSFKLTGVSPGLSVGILGDLRAGRDDSVSRATGQFSIGVLFAPVGGPDYSIVYRGLGQTIGYASSPVAGRDVTRGNIVESPRSLEIGSTMRYPESNKIPVMTLSVAGERDFISKVFRVKGGLEATFFSMLNLRLGYIKAETSQLRCGLGFTASWFSMDYAVMPSDQDGQFDEITLKFAL